MEYRMMENIGARTSLLGFGCMRFSSKKEGGIDEEKAFSLIDTAYKNGVNYFDTAYPYLDGKSENLTGRALARYPRDSFYLATKLPTWFVDSKEKAEQIFAEQLSRLGMDYIDFYLLHGMNRDGFKKLCDLGIIELCEKWQAEGKIKYFGFSFHDNYEVFEYIIKYRKWDFCQIQLNYMDSEEQATLKGVALAEELGVPLVIMEPIKGGTLARIPDDAKSVLDACEPGYSASAWALRWVGTFSAVKVILSGMNEPEQLSDNLSTFESFKALDDAGMAAVDSAKKTILSRVRNGCTGCRYCMPCPNGVDIPRVFSIWNEYGKYGNAGGAKWGLSRMRPESKPGNCIECGACEGKCPQNLSIIDDLKRARSEIEAL